MQLADDRVADLVPRVLADAGLDPHRLGLEVTETAIVEAASTPQARARLRDLHDRGISIALDDFGTGFSSLEHLRRFPIDVIRIDRSFIEGVEHDPKDSAIAANLVSLAHALGLDVVAEGIETPGQLELLRELGCDLAQGSARTAGPGRGRDRAPGHAAQPHRDRRLRDARERALPHLTASRRGASHGHFPARRA